MKQGTGYRRAAALATMAIGLAAGWAAPAVAAEIYTWTDEDGITHFSDTPPLSGDSDLLSVEDAYRPGTAGAYPSPEETPAEAGADDSEASLQSVAQQRRDELAEQRRERREAQAEADRACNLHRDRLTRMEPARRVFYTNEQGESVRMDDNQRVELIEQSRSFLEDNCS